MENKTTWILIDNEFGKCLIKVEENGDTRAVPLADDNTDYQEYLASLEATEPEEE